MGGEWMRAPRLQPEPPNEPEPAFRAQPEPANEGRQPGLVVWSPPAPKTTALANTWSSKVFILDEVDLPANGDRRLLLLREPESPAARGYRLLRHRLLAHSDPRVIVVTSAEPGEGKTTCAVNLALALAEETMARVLLVEANLRRPALGRVFGYEPSESFVGRMAEYRDATPPYSVAAIIGTRLQVAALPASVPPDARLDRMLLAVALQELREVFDYVVVDAASVLESADADVASVCADGVVVAARASKSRKNTLTRAVEQLSPARVLGTVLLDT
ncbi:MAG TPA: CpsD/CapB family tyrosine-protein kinase [Polyangiaceae bacterium]|nr:CpsD/CapB family tyrosine-protein kinase [Polyangiaceae bacterium]